MDNSRKIIKSNYDMCHYSCNGFRAISPINIMDKSTMNFAQLYWILSIILISIHSVNAFHMCLSHVCKVDHYANRQSIRGSRGGEVRPIRTLITNSDEIRLDQVLIHTQNNRSNLIQVKQDN